MALQLFAALSCVPAVRRDSFEQSRVSIMGRREGMDMLTLKPVLPMMRLFTARILNSIRSVSGLLAVTPTSTCVFRSHLVVACSAFYSYLVTAKRSPR